MFDINKLTLGEIAKFESLSNISIDQFDLDETPKGRAMAALAFIIKRRTGDPKFTWEQALDLTMAEVQEILGMGEDEDPKDEPSAPKKKASAAAAPKTSRSS